MLSSATRNTVAQSYPGVHPVEAAARKTGCTVIEFLTNAAEKEQVPSRVADCHIEAFMHALSADFRGDTIIPFFSVSHVEAVFKPDNDKGCEEVSTKTKKKKKKKILSTRRRFPIARGH